MFLQTIFIQIFVCISYGKCSNFLTFFNCTRDRSVQKIRRNKHALEDWMEASVGMCFRILTAGLKSLFENGWNSSVLFFLLIFLYAFSRLVRYITYIHWRT